MTVVIVLLFFAFFVGLDYVLNARHAPRPAASPTPAPTPVPVVPEESVWVAGYELPERLRYHPGHTWARVLSPDTVAVGIDDFARHLVGEATAVRTPRQGDWVRQGHPGVEIETNGRSAALLSPVEGEVLEVNPVVHSDPGAVSRDPYGRGWLYKVRSAALATNLRNLFSGRLAQRWTEDAREQLELRLMALSGSVLQDGGAPSADFAEHLETDEWRRLLETFLLTR